MMSPEIRRGRPPRTAGGETMSLLADHNMPFAAALVLMVLIALLIIGRIGPI